MVKCSSDLVARPGEKLLRQWTSENGTAIQISDIISAYSHACASMHKVVQIEKWSNHNFIFLPG